MARPDSSPRILALALALVLVAPSGCEGTLGGGWPDAASQRRDRGPSDSRARTERQIPVDRALGDRPRVLDKTAYKDLKNPCVPLPKACLCVKACQSNGSCINSLCPCPAISGVSYTATLGPTNPYSGDMSKHGDVNLLLRKKKVVSYTKGLVNYGGATDTTPGPQLYSLFTDDRVPNFSNVYQVEAWDWSCNCPNGYITSPDVTLAGMATKVGEVIRTPYSGYNIGNGHTATVLYAAPNTITLKYTREDDVVWGYTVHLSGICVEPTLQKLYDKCNAAGRKDLPALNSRQALGRATGTEIQVSIRDTGSWMDPRSRKDWWQGK